jgi:hypothetical protein
MINPAIGKMDKLVKIVSEGIDYFDVITRNEESHIIAHVHHNIPLPCMHAPIDSVYLTFTFTMCEVDIRFPLQFEVMGTIQRYIIIIINRYTDCVIRFV